MQSTMSTRINCWDNADALLMAIRLRKTNKCPVDIDNLYGEIVKSLVNMATELLLKSPSYQSYGKEFRSEDVQMTMLVHALTALEKNADTTKEPKAVVNYAVKTVQNRLRNYVRDTSKRASKVQFVTESELDADIFEAGPVTCDVTGQQIYNTYKTHKVDTCDRNY